MVVGPSGEIELFVLVQQFDVGFTITDIGVEVEEQLPYDTLTLYVPLVVTVIDCDVAPFDHVLPEAEEDVNTTESPWQKIVEFDAVIVGKDPTGLTVTWS